MRFDRLDLTRYGKFTDASLPFGPARERETPDLHIVYGNNEAGKTTMLNAMLDLVFGIDVGTPYKFLHQPAALRLGGALEIGGASREVIRLLKSGLLDADERPLAEGLFSEDLAGLNRATYQTMFSLDEKTLAAGGESIVASRGDLGQLLFSATAGLSDFANALTRLRAETETFYKLHGRKHLLGDLKKQLADLKERRTAIDVTAAPFARLLVAREEAQAVYDAAVQERGQLQVRLATVRRQLAAIPRLVEWKRLKVDYEELPRAPSVPDGWPEALADLQRTVITLRTRRATVEEEIERLGREVDALPLDEAGLALAARVTQAADLRARDATAAKDLPDRRAGLRVADAKVAELLRELGFESLSSPRDLLLPTSLVNRLRQSLESLSGLTAAQNDAATEFAEAESRLADAAGQLEALRAVPEDLAATSRLERALASVETDDSSSRLRLAERACARHDGTLKERLRALAPWQGDGDTLDGLDLPQRRECEQLAQGRSEAEADLIHWRNEVERLGHERHRTIRTREELIAEGGLVDDATAISSRDARDTAWSHHLATMDRDSAAIFARALREDDAVASARFAQAADLSELRALGRTFTALSADLELAQTQREAAEHRLEQADARIVSRFAVFVGAEHKAPLAAFEAFSARRERALDARNLLSEAETDRRAAEAACAETRERLVGALAGVGLASYTDASLDTLSAQGRAFLDGVQERRELRGRVEALTREAAERRRQMQRAEQGRARWQEDWREALQPTWLAGKDVGGVRDALATLGELGPALEFRDGLADRVTKMEADRAAFAIETRRQAAILGLADAADVLELADNIAARSRNAVADSAARASRIEDRRQAQGRLAALRPAIDAADARGQEMMEVFSVGTLDELAIALDGSRQRESLAIRLRELEIEICAACSAESIDDALAKLASFELDAVERHQAELEALCEDQVARAQDRFAALERARDAVARVDGDASAARLEEERRTILVEIEERTLAHLAMRAGIIAAEGAIGLYRDRHRSSMMKSASALFASLTRGAYSGLAAQTLKNGEVLVGLVGEGGSRLSHEMSTATRNQLYLALRIAAYREFTKTRRPVPFVLDDILETFDDERAEASLAMLADMANTGQVIYLTHHKHLCAIARRVCPVAQLHDLGSVG